MDIGKSVKIALAQRGQGQAWLREKLDCDRQQSSYYCRVQRQSSKNIEKLAEVFDLPVSEFIALGEIDL